jgi:type IV pilus assembly protein PilN
MIKVNLLKPEKKEISTGGEVPSYMEEPHAKKVSMGAIAAALAISVGVIGGLYLLQNNRLNREKEQLENFKVKKAELEKVLQSLDAVQRTKAELDNKIKVINDLKQRQKDTVVMMDRLSRCLPDWVWLTDLSFAGGTINLNGKALTNNLIVDFINNLTNSNYFLNVQLKTTVSKKQGGTEIFEFKLECVFNRAMEPSKAV